MSYATRSFALISLLLCCATSFAGTVKRFEISKATQEKSPIDFSVTITPDTVQNGHVFVELAFPSAQQELADLWKVYLWIMDDKKTVLGAPLDLRQVRRPKEKKNVEMIAVNYHGRVDTIRRCLIAIRCGKRAPLVETIYQIDVGSYLDKDLARSPDDAALRKAVSIAKSAAVEQSFQPANDLVVLSAQQMFFDGKFVWRVTFKSASLLSKDPSKSPIAKGGEIFVNVDMSTKKSVVRYGE